ncbi:MAG TPA: hypothetical protein PK109_00855 [Candidatus Paceibacterota bacterium]|nr:hypothetical protein [Candidatus Paceibacterota bacterium]
MSEDIPLAPEHLGPSHYYGDIVRILFVVAAALLFLSQFIGEPFMTSFSALTLAVILVVAAGLTNPVQAWIHWVNIFLSGLSLILFGAIAIARYRETGTMFGSTAIVMILVLVFLFALYNAIKTLRGTIMRDAPVIR